jgi:NTE family protein
MHRESYGGVFVATDRQVDFILVGGGLAGAKAAETLRREGTQGSILMLSAERELPYHRPSLSKRYLLGQADSSQILVHSAEFYQEQEIEIILGTRVVGVDSVGHLVVTEDGSRLRYGKLLLATGARPRHLAARGDGLAGVHTLRTKADCDAIRTAAIQAKRAVVVGGSFLGMEVAMSLRELGLEVSVVEGDDRLLRHLESAHLSEFFADHARERGLVIHTGDPVVSFHGRKHISGIETESGERIACDLAVLCTGVAPSTDFLESSGILLDEGRIVVDEQLRTSASDVYAAGDAVSFFDPVFQRRRHIEHWDNAIRQGRLAALNMLGRRLRYDDVSYFFCEVGDIGFDVLGDTADADERIGRGSLADHSYAQFYLKEGVPRAVFSLGRPPGETRLAESLIRYRSNLQEEKEKLRDPEFGLDQFARQNVLVLQGGGALGAFECGVVQALEEEGIHPDIVAGISIGALNGAIIAGNPRNATAVLESFWAELQVQSQPFLPEPWRRAATALQIIEFGVPKFFLPRWLPSADMSWATPWKWTGLYDTTPMKHLLEKYVDFSSLKSSPVRLIVGAVNVLTGELEAFDSYVDDLTPEHVLASGSLPPGFSWTFVNGTPYWDGGVVSNSPLDLVIDRCGPDGKRVFIVDLFSGEKSLPKNIMEVLARRDEIVYSERVRNDLRAREMRDAYRSLVQSILNEVDPAARDKIRQRPRYVQLMGDGALMSITRFVRKGPADEPSSRDYDFSDIAIEANRTHGYVLAKQVLAAQQQTASVVLPDQHDFSAKPDVVTR